MILELTAVNTNQVTYTGWSEDAPKDERVPILATSLTIPYAEWVYAGRPGAVHITTAFTISVPR